jgi:nuclear transport factor 2 (NTF2) superfamily protein
MRTIIVPPFTDPELAAQKVQIAEDLWNTRDPERVAAAYTEDTQWRNRIDFLTGRAAVIEFLKRKWERELDYKLKRSYGAFATGQCGEISPPHEMSSIAGALFECCQGGFRGLDAENARSQIIR